MSHIRITDSGIVSVMPRKLEEVPSPAPKGLEAMDVGPKPTAASSFAEQAIAAQTFPCTHCDFIARSAAGLKAHGRTHDSK